MHEKESRRDGRMKVLHVYRTYFPDAPGGLQEAIRQIRQSTRPHGVSSTVFCLSPRPHPQLFEAADGPVVRARSWLAPASCDLGGMAAFYRFARLAAEHDLIHYHFPWPFADLLHLATRPRVPGIMTYHSDIVRQARLGRLYSPLMWRTLQAMSAIVATSPAYIATSPVLQDPRIAKRVQMIPLGMEDLSTYTRPALAPPVTQDRPYFLFIGALRYYKGLENLVEAARHVDASVLIAGEGPQKERLEAQAKAAAADNVVFLGQVDDAQKRALLAQCHAFVMPSNRRSEAFGMAMVEASMFGKPLISCEIGTGTSYVNAHEQTGLVVPKDDPAALAAAMNQLLHEPETATRLGWGARAHYKANLSDIALGQSYAQLYRDLLKKPDQAAG